MTTREHLDRMYDEVLQALLEGQTVPTDVIADLEAEGYVFPRLDDEDDGENGVSLNEVTVSFTDYNHDTTVDVLVDKDGDIWLSSPENDEGAAILLSRQGAQRLHDILAEVLDDEVVE